MVHKLLFVVTQNLISTTLLFETLVELYPEAPFYHFLPLFYFDELHQYYASKITMAFVMLRPTLSPFLCIPKHHLLDKEGLNNIIFYLFAIFGCLVYVFIVPEVCPCQTRT
ncbi:Uncharacterized protein TCM_013669 [Theobroma cacao]|uniref:Uncharacterized protein n=1 Tax=Theobroma cacao TaxID=3641 RepID=A0A061FWP6_THECC|nr:Uncharacterized protein TCM_013669 [Theobroma cacao]